MFGSVPNLPYFDELYGIEKIIEKICVFVFDDKTAIPYIVLESTCNN